MLNTSMKKQLIQPNVLKLVIVQSSITKLKNQRKFVYPIRKTVRLLMINSNKLAKLINVHKIVQRLNYNTLKVIIVSQLVQDKLNILTTRFVLFHVVKLIIYL